MVAVDVVAVVVRVGYKSNNSPSTTCSNRGHHHATVSRRSPIYPSNNPSKGPLPPCITHPLACATASVLGPESGHLMSISMLLLLLLYPDGRQMVRGSPSRVLEHILLPQSGWLLRYRGPGYWAPRVRGRLISSTFRAQPASPPDCRVCIYSGGDLKRIQHTRTQTWC